MTVSILIISNHDDFSTDLVCCSLKKNNINYLRVNRNDFPNYKVNWDIARMELKIIIDDQEFVINSNLSAVYYRAPTFLRESFYKECSYEEQLQLSQWMAFIRNLTAFDNAFCMNNPKDIYLAENKIYQLKLAKSMGLTIPSTFVQNNTFDLVDDFKYAVKSIDTAIFGDTNNSYFTYTQILTGSEISQYKLNLAPVCLQEYLEDKLDIRVTYIDGHFFASIIKSNCPIEGDWRKNKTGLIYEACELPVIIKDGLNRLMKKLALSFGGIDLIFSNNQYYFIEVNPTGEWGWLMEPCSYDFPNIIADSLIKRIKK